MACNKQNTQYSTHFPRLNGGSRRNLWIGNRGSELGTFHGTGRKAYHFQFVIVFVCISFFCFSLFTPPLLPPPPLCCTNVILLHVARSPPSHSHSLCMSFAWQKSKKKWAKWAKWAASWRLGRINTKTKATTSDETIRYPLGNGQVDWSREVEKNPHQIKIFFWFVEQN